MSHNKTASSGFPALRGSSGWETVEPTARPTTVERGRFRRVSLRVCSCQAGTDPRRSRVVFTRRSSIHASRRYHVRRLTAQTGAGGVGHAWESIGTGSGMHRARVRSRARGHEYRLIRTRSGAGIRGRIHDVALRELRGDGEVATHARYLSELWIRRGGPLRIPGIDRLGERFYALTTN